MSDWLLALLIALGAALLGGSIGLALFRAYLADERQHSRRTP